MALAVQVRQERQDHAVVVLQRLARHQRALTLQPEVVVSRPPVTLGLPQVQNRVTERRLVGRPGHYSNSFPGPAARRTGSMRLPCRRRLMGSSGGTPRPSRISDAAVPRSGTCPAARKPTMGALSACGGTAWSFRPPTCWSPAAVVANVPIQVLIDDASSGRSRRTAAAARRADAGLERSRRPLVGRRWTSRANEARRDLIRLNDGVGRRAHVKLNVVGRSRSLPRCAGRVAGALSPWRAPATTTQPRSWDRLGRFPTVPWSPSNAC
jgi:hypothetical protein